ncbi:DUF2283 domain-containing protein [Methanobrevibacter curvatus]|uniref:DUF2283 domain-containing protein n=1 Tax=Methanobrevibacter curvatus TaxID=49547 RepID=A0A165ZGZ4_9EURY|nr:DUF2283 domain-containing protein [Methanobrevibacter curvatus]KZX10701.1 hypothetical protein MBCUR_16940 [Methanobrevibacter curvatus]
MKSKETMNIDYDHDHDILFVSLDDEVYKDYDYSEFLNDSVSIDFTKKNRPVGVEIANASKQFKTEKVNFHNILSGDINIKINKKTIMLTVSLLVEIRNGSIHLNPIKVEQDNLLNIPNIETNGVIA